MKTSQENILTKIPPQELELETVVLGAILLEKEAFYQVNSILTADSFYKESHQLIYKAVNDLVQESQPVDILTVMAKLRSKNELDEIGGAYYLTELSERVASSANIETHAAIVQERFLARELIRLNSLFTSKAYEGVYDVFELYEDIQSQLYNLTERNLGRTSTQLNSIIAERIKHYEITNHGNLTGITSGFESIDFITAGWQPSDLVIVAGRPGMGKTAFMLSLSRNAAIVGKQSIAIFSLEMSKEQLTDRLISSETDIHLEKLRRRELDAVDFQKVHSMTTLINSEIFIDDSPAISIQAMKSKCTRLKRRHDVGLIVVDYLQLMRGELKSNGNREQEISTISRGLKEIAKSLNVPVIALSQLSRAVESRPGAAKRPMLSDLRESGSIEQDADQVIFLFRPEYYGITKDDHGNDLTGLTEVIFAKNRHGALDTAVLKFNGGLMKFSDLQDDQIPF